MCHQPDYVPVVGSRPAASSTHKATEPKRCFRKMHGHGGQVLITSLGMKPQRNDGAFLLLFLYVSLMSPTFRKD